MFDAYKKYLNVILISAPKNVAQMPEPFWQSSEQMYEVNNTRASV